MVENIPINWKWGITNAIGKNCISKAFETLTIVCIIFDVQYYISIKKSMDVNTFIINPKMLYLRGQTERQHSYVHSFSFWICALEMCSVTISLVEGQKGINHCLTLCLPHTNPLCATLFWSALELGHHFWKYFLQLAVSFYL